MNSSPDKTGRKETPASIMTVPTECELMHRLRQSPGLFDLLRASFGSELHVQDRLRREFPAELVRAACELAELRHKAAGRFSRAGQMWFDRRRLEQSTSERVARYKAKRFAGNVRDYCCGIGADTIALAEHCEVLAVDCAPAACLRTQWNAEVYGVAASLRTVCADVTTLTPGAELVHIDPDRRPGRGGRTIRIEEAVPGLEFLRSMMQSFRGGAIKLSPAGNFTGKFPAAEIELVSLDGECKEATVWFGELAEPELWRATILPQNATLAGRPLESYSEVGPVGRYLYDPDPAVVRSGLLDLLAEQTGLYRTDADEEYLTSDRLIDSPFVRAFAVLDVLPNNTRAIRQAVRRAEIGQIEIKCRRIPIRPETIRGGLPLSGSRPGVLVFARCAGKARAVLCRRISRRQ